MFVKVVLDIPVNQVYTYSVPRELADQAETGKRVKINFHNRVTTGYIIAVENLDPGRDPDITIKPIISVIDPIPVFNTILLKLGQWISEYYHSSLGEVLKIMCPVSEKAKPFDFSQYKESSDERVQLTARQNSIYQELTQLALPDTALIYGITGSGKTEIYLKLIRFFIKKKSRPFILSLK